MGVVNTAFTAVANGNGSFGTDAELIVGGTFVGTAKLQVQIPDAAGAAVWVDVGSLTAPGLVNYRGAVGRTFRAICSAFTSGTILTSLGTATNEEMFQTP